MWQKLHFEPWVVIIVESMAGLHGSISQSGDGDGVTLALAIVNTILGPRSSEPPQSDGSLYQQVHVQLVLNHRRSHCQLRNN